MARDVVQATLTRPLLRDSLNWSLRATNHGDPLVWCHRRVLEKVKSLAHHIRRLVAELVTEGRRRPEEAMEVSYARRGAMSPLKHVVSVTSRARL